VTHNERTMHMIHEAHETIKKEITVARNALKEASELLVKHGEKYDDLLEQKEKQSQQNTNNV
jgi:hypothetical protein